MVMSVFDVLSAGNLAEAITIQEQAVCRSPRDRGSQILLSQFYLLAGEYRRAWQGVRGLSAATPGERALHRQLLRLIRADYRRCERGIAPAFLEPDPPRHARQRWKAIQALRRGDVARALRRIDRADTITPAVTGTLDGREFDGFRDADDRFASSLELLIDDEYAWVPWEEIRLLRLSPIQSFFDFAFRPCQLWLWQGQTLEAVVPMIYPGTAQAFDGDTTAGGLLCGRETDWRADQAGLAIGVGARYLLAGDEELAMKDCQQIEFRRLLGSYRRSS